MKMIKRLRLYSVVVIKIRKSSGNTSKQCLGLLILSINNNYRILEINMQFQKFQPYWL